MRFSGKAMGEYMEKWSLKEMSSEFYDKMYKTTQKYAEDATRMAYPYTYEEELSTLNKFLKKVESETLK